MGLGGVCFDIGKTLVPDWGIGSIEISFIELDIRTGNCEKSCVQQTQSSVQLTQPIFASTLSSDSTLIYAEVSVVDTLCSHRCVTINPSRLQQLRVLMMSLPVFQHPKDTSGQITIEQNVRKQ